MIELEDVRKTYGNFTAVDGISLQVRPGEIIALLGPNGAGKTTTVRILSALLSPTSGTARVAGYNVVTDGQQVRRMVGLLTEVPGLYSRMNAWEYLDFFGELQGVKANLRKERAQQLLERFGLWGSHTRDIGSFSKGMKQKLSLIRAVIHDPQVLFLDEPTSAMDPASAKVVRDFIAELCNGERTIVICTHNLAEAEALSDQVAIIARGKLVAQGSTTELKDRILGERSFELRLAHNVARVLSCFSGDIKITELGDDWVRFRTCDPQVDNPALLCEIIDSGAKVVSLSELPRSLEMVYLQTVH